MTLSSASICPASDVERGATLVRVYAYLIEKGRQHKKQSPQPVGDPQPENLPSTAPQSATEDDPECLRV